MKFTVFSHNKTHFYVYSAVIMTNSLQVFNGSFDEHGTVLSGCQPSEQAKQLGPRVYL